MRNDDRESFDHLVEEISGAIAGLPRQPKVQAIEFTADNAAEAPTAADSQSINLPLKAAFDSAGWSSKALSRAPTMAQ